MTSKLFEQVYKSSLNTNQVTKKREPSPDFTVQGVQIKDKNMSLTFGTPTLVGRICPIPFLRETHLSQ